MRTHYCRHGGLGGGAGRLQAAPAQRGALLLRLRRSKALLPAPGSGTGNPQQSREVSAASIGLNSVWKRVPLTS